MNHAARQHANDELLNEAFGWQHDMDIDRAVAPRGHRSVAVPGSRTADSDPDRDEQIAELRRALREADERYRELHAMWRAGLHEAQRVKAWSVVKALNGEGLAAPGQAPSPQLPRSPTARPRTRELCDFFAAQVPNGSSRIALHERRALPSTT